LCNQLPKRFGKRKIPTYQQPDFAQRRVEDLMRSTGGGSEVFALWSPEVFLDVFACYDTGGGDEVAYI
jgi:hypothetical protein